VGKHATLLLRWKMNVPKTRAETDFWKETKTKQTALNMSKIKEVETHTCGSCSFWMQKMRHKPMEKLLLFVSDNQRKTSSFVLLVFYSQPSSYSLYFLSFFYFLLTSLCFLSPLSLLLCFVFLFPLFLSPSSEDFHSRKDERKTPLVLPCSLRFSLLSFSFFFFIFLLPIACLSLISPLLGQQRRHIYTHTHTHT